MSTMGWSYCLSQLSFQLGQLSLEFDHGVCDNARGRAAREAVVVGPAAAALSWSSRRRSRRRETGPSAGVSSIPKSLNPLKAGSSLVIADYLTCSFDGGGLPGSRTDQPFPTDADPEPPTAPPVHEQPPDAITSIRIGNDTTKVAHEIPPML